MLLVLFGGVLANVRLSRSKGRKGGWIVSTVGWARGVTIAVYAVHALNGAHLNPAVTIALASIGKFEWSRVPAYILAQTAGGLLGGGPIFRTGRSPRTKARNWPSSAQSPPCAGRRPIC